MEQYLDLSIDIANEKLDLGLFIWAWKFHNAVNSRINKPIMGWDTAYNLYSEKESLVCSKNCLDTDTDNHQDNHHEPIPNTNNIDDLTQPFHLISIHR